MRLLILLQLLVAILEISKSEDEPHTTIILNDSQTEMSVEQVKNTNGGRPTHELFDNLSEIESDGNDLDFDYDDDEEPQKAGMKNPDMKEQQMQEVLLKAMKKPAIRKQIGEVIPILRVMSPAQRLTLAALVSSQIMSHNTLSEENLTELATMFANRNLENASDRHNITEHLLLPISMDIAKMFKGLGKEVGRNLRQNFYRPSDPLPTRSNVRRVTRRPDIRRPDIRRPDTKRPDIRRSDIRRPDITRGVSNNRRMDEVDYYESEEQLSVKPVAEALKQPGRDECDYFTKSLCLEVSNYPTEAIILSLKKNQDIAKTFLTDFEVQPAEERGRQDPKNQSSGRRLERRQDGQNEVHDFAPEGGYMCPSSVKYAKPKRARTTSGQWKYVVNAGDYTQTLRLEICQKPKSPCSYVTNHLNSQCAQVFNYHRLLTWDESKGLHMDIFKVPSCCSCHIQGYSNFYPPDKDFTVAEKRKEPLEGADSIPELQKRPPYGYLGNKREVSKNIPNVNTLPVPVRNQSQLINTKEFYRDPVDHLVPPGPPLPLENEGIYSSYSETAFGQKKKVVREQDRRYPPQAEYRKTTGKLSEGAESFKELPPNTRLKTPVPSIPDRTSVKFSKPHVPEVVPGVQEPTPIFDSPNQIHFTNPSPSTPPTFPNFDIVREKPSGGTVFITPNPHRDLVYTSPPKINPKPTSQFFKPEYIDSKSLPSMVSPAYATPPKVKVIESRPSSTSPTPQKSETLTSSGQKKINYNYHPIIDFFRQDSKKRQLTYSSPHFLPLASQDWTPVVAH